MDNWNDSIVWLVTTLIFLVLIPVWKRRRVYFIAAGILFFSPVFIIYDGYMSYFSIWPWIVSIPGYIFFWPGSWKLFVFYVLPTNVVVGLVFWGIAMWRKI